MVNLSPQHHGFAILIELHRMQAELPGLTERALEKSKVHGLGSTEMLEFLWDNVANPVLDTLGFTGPRTEDKWPHVWWMPSGQLNRLPLHQAVYHKRYSDETVIDRVVSSYSSSIKAILQQRKNYKQPSTRDQALLVAMEYTQGHSQFPFAAKEVEELQHLCKSMGLETVQPKRSKQDVI